MDRYTDSNLASATRSGFPGFADLTDATKLSLYFIVGSLVVIILCWPSYMLGGPCRKDVKLLEPILDDEGHQVFERGIPKFKRVPSKEDELREIDILWVFKNLTVLFHEMSHVIVGSLTLGQVAYISINARHGGETGWRPSHAPARRPTLAAGYLGSCLIGCSLLGAGFDALTSKKAAIALVGYLLFTAVVCGCIRTKSTFRYNWERINMRIRQFCWKPTIVISEQRLYDLQRQDAKLARGSSKLRLRMKHAEELDQKLRARKGSLSPEGEADLQKTLAKKVASLETVYRHKMVSLERILLVTSAVSFGAILPAWLIADSVGLRFVIMFIGLFSAIYAVQDIYEDSMKDDGVRGSDACAFAELMTTKPAPRPRKKRYPVDQKAWRQALTEWEVSMNAEDGQSPIQKWQELMVEYWKKVGSRTKQIAWISLVLQLLAILITILTSVYVVRTTTAEQALESRTFWPSPWHFSGADLLETAKAGGQILQDSLDWGQGKVEERTED